MLSRLPDRRQDWQVSHTIFAHLGIIPAARAEMKKARWADPGSEAAGSGVTGVNRRIIVQNRNGGFLYPVPINTCESNTLTSP